MSTLMANVTDPEITNPVISMDGIIEICEEIGLDAGSDVSHKPRTQYFKDATLCVLCKYMN